MSGGILNRLFGKKEFLNYSVLRADMHSHFIPGIDDGSVSVEDTIAMITAMQQMGYQKFITTPHIQPDLFNNTEDSIRSQFNLLKEELLSRGIDADLRVAAEYFVDENFLERIEAGAEFLTISDNHILIEVSMVAQFKDLEKVIFELMLKGYKVILAHVERYPYLYANYGLNYYQTLRDMEVLLQVNLRSFTGNYGEIQRKIARDLAQNDMVDLLGSDLHRPMQISLIEEAMHDEHVQRLLSKDKLLNKTL